MKTIIRDDKKWELRANRGSVSYLMKAGRDFVRNVMSEDGAYQIMTDGVLTESAMVPGSPICVDDQFFFPGNVSEIEAEPAEKPQKKGLKAQ